MIYLLVKRMIHSLNNIVTTLNNYYSDNDIYKSFIVCTTDEDVNNLAKIMEKELYTVYTLTSNDVNSVNNVNTINSISFSKLRNFNNTDYRVLIITYDIWNLINNDLEKYILPEQNLIVLYLNTNQKDNIYNWIKDTFDRGFITRPSSNIMIIEDDKLEIETLIDQNYVKCKDNMYNTHIHEYIY